MSEIYVHTGKDLLESGVTKFDVTNGAWIGEVAIRNNQPHLYCKDYDGNLVNSYSFKNATILDLQIRPLSYTPLREKINAMKTDGMAMKLYNSIAKEMSNSYDAFIFKQFERHGYSRDDVMNMAYEGRITCVEQSDFVSTYILDDVIPLFEIHKEMGWRTVDNNGENSDMDLKWFCNVTCVDYPGRDVEDINETNGQRD